MFAAHALRNVLRWSRYQMVVTGLHLIINTTKRPLHPSWLSHIDPIALANLGGENDHRPLQLIHISIQLNVGLCWGKETSVVCINNFTYKYLSIHPEKHFDFGGEKGLWWYPVLQDGLQVPQVHLCCVKALYGHLKPSRALGDIAKHAHNNPLQVQPNAGNKQTTYTHTGGDSGFR